MSRYSNAKRQQYTRQHIPDPIKYLLAAMINCAFEDLQPKNDPYNRLSARYFLQGTLYLQICNHLGLRPHHARKTADEAIAKSPTPTMSQKQIQAYRDRQEWTQKGNSKRKNYKG